MNIKWLSAFVPSAKQAVAGIIVLVVTTVVTAVITAHVNRGDNFELVYKNQELNQLQKFQASGEVVDTSFRLFNDALSDGLNIVSAREKLRSAIAQHSSDAFASQNLLGVSAVQSYLASLGRFRQQIDVASRPTNAMPMAQAGLDLIKQRNGLVAAAELKIGIAPDTQKGLAWYRRL